MHARIYTTRNSIRVDDAYGIGYRMFYRNHHQPIRKQMHKCVQRMLDIECEAQPSVWWNRMPYSVSIRPADSGERGEWVYSVNRLN